MDFFEALHSYLINHSKVNEVIGDRLYPIILPQEPTLPAIVYNPVSANYGKALQKDTGYVAQKVQFSMHDKSFGKARKLSRVIKEVLQNFAGDISGINVQATHLLTDIAANTNTTARYNAEEYICILEFEFNYMEQA